ncbi:MAG: FenI protein [Ruminococcaceae bacterium]|nr:FenI protein [Oscillospiraceae bacterium]
MKKTISPLARIITIFTVSMVLFALVGKISRGVKPTGNTDTPPPVDTGGSYGDALSDYEKNGMKGIWISYIEFQSVDFSSRENFADDISEMFENCKNMGLNTVIVHARPFGDAFYKSSFFPYSHIMTGTQGTDVGYDPMEIMIATAHEIGLRFEAWVNPYRVKLYNHPKELAANNPAQKSTLTITTDSGIYYNPALQEVRDLVTEGVVEIVKNYNVDGIHFDDYFYPDTAKELDESHYAAYSGNLSLEDWRRENVNMLIKQVYAAVKQANPDVEFGISPQGNDDNNYNMQYSDIKLWLGEKGYADYIMPQLYWGFDYTTKSGSDRYAFKNLSYEWSQYKKADGVKLYMGLGAYRIGDGDGSYTESDEWQKGDNLAAMMQVTKANPRLDGYALYSYNSMFDRSTYADIKAAEVKAVTEFNNG